MRAWEEIRALLLPVLDFLAKHRVLASLSCFLRILIEEYMQELHLVMWDPKNIVIEDLEMIFSNKLADLLDIKLLEL